MEHIKKMIKDLWRGLTIASKNYLEGKTGWGKF